MTHPDPSFATSARTVTLTDTESGAVEQALRSFMREHPVNMGKAVAKNERRSGWDVFTSLFSMRYGTAMASILVCVLGGGSLSYAAESALPGDALYPIKVNVNEEVRAKLAVSKETRVAWHTMRAERRIHEVEQLADKGRLTPEAGTTLIAAFNAHMKHAEQDIQVIADAGDTTQAVALNSRLETKLVDRAVALDKRVSKHKDEKKKDRDTIALVLQNVKHASEENAHARESLNRQIALRAENTVTLSVAADSSAQGASSEIDTVIAIAAKKNNQGQPAVSALRNALKDHNDPDEPTSTGITVNTTVQTILSRPPDKKDTKKDQKKNGNHGSRSSTGSGSALSASSASMTSVSSSAGTTSSDAEPQESDDHDEDPALPAPVPALPLPTPDLQP